MSAASCRTCAGPMCPMRHNRRLERIFRMLLAQQRADMADASVLNLRGIVLIGRSGSGKTTAMREFRRSSSDLIRSDPMQEICEFIGLQVPSPATMKFLGTATLQACGYPTTRDKAASAIWDMVKQRLMFRKTLFLHFDEAQDLTRFQTENERRAVVNTLKSLMENSQWPVSLILTGTPELKAIINQDPQLARRLYPIEIDRLNACCDAAAVLDLLRHYVRRAGCSLEDDLAGEGFAQRLMHAADYEFGLMAELIVQALSAALFTEGVQTTLRLGHFGDVFHMRSNAVDGLNPFLAEDFRRIDPRQVLGDMPERVR